ncbi:MAG: hypothetical protein GF401_10270 [Chitinivibrionales bacterium]|nr:hypothetical protein [Chitinivibrionales bacterium]
MQNTSMALLLLLVSLSFSQTWEPAGGPCGGYVLCLSASNGRFFAGTYRGGVFMSDDSGATWRHSPETYSLSFNDIVCKGDTLYGGTWYNGILMSHDKGETWENIYFDTMSLDNDVGALALLDGILFAGTQMSLLRSEDNGKTWTNLSIEPDFPRFYFFSDFEKISDYYFSGSKYNGVMRSRDKGLTWEIINNGLQDKKVYSLAVVDTILFAGTYMDNVYRSTDFGESWQKSDDGISEYTAASYIFSFNGFLLYDNHDALYLSEDTANLWNKLNDNLDIINILAVNNEKFLLAGHGPGIYFYNLSNNTIASRNNKLYSHTIQSLSSNNNTLLATTYHYASFLSIDSGKTWQTVHEKELFENHIRSQACHVKGNDLYLDANGGIFHRNMEIDTGWSTMNDGMGDTVGIRGFGSIGTYVFAASERGRVYRKRDGDTTWQACTTGLRSQEGFRTIIENNGRLFLTGYEFYISDDSGSTWISKLTDETTRFVACAAEGDVVYVNRYTKGVCRSLDNGDTWEEPYMGLPRVKALATWNGLVFAGTLGGGVFMSSDSAKTWEPFNEGLWNYGVLSMTIQNNTLFAGTQGSSIFKLDLTSIPGISGNSNVRRVKQEQKIKLQRSGAVYRIQLPANKGIKSIEVYDLHGRNLRRVYPDKENEKILKNDFSIRPRHSGNVLLRLNMQNAEEIIPAPLIK